jgi:glutathione S-transferase
MKLYTSIGPNPRVVRMFAAEKGVALDLEQVDIIAGDCRREPYLSINPMGSTPALVLESGQIVTEVLAICEYLEESAGGPSLIGTTPAERAQVRMWTRRIDLGYVDPLTLGFRAAGGRTMFAPRLRVAREDAAPDLIGMASDMLDVVERRLAEQPFVAGEGFSLADILLFSFVDFSGQVGIAALADRPALSAWFAKVGARPSAAA